MRKSYKKNRTYNNKKNIMLQDFEFQMIKKGKISNLACTTEPERCTKIHLCHADI